MCIHLDRNADGLISVRGKTLADRERRSHRVLVVSIVVETNLCHGSRTSSPRPTFVYGRWKREREEREGTKGKESAKRLDT